MSLVLVSFIHWGFDFGAPISWRGGRGGVACEKPLAAVTFQLFHSLSGSPAYQRVWTR